tara:strand:+ start:2790 stop:3443 length:654 start_codon:yes stop_codon:yes gene_type:complete
MCAPTKDLAKIALIAGVAYATGGMSLGPTAATTATTAASTAATVGTTTTSSGIFSTLATYAKTAAPYIGAIGSIFGGVVQKQMFDNKANIVNFQAGQDAQAYDLRKARRQRESRLAYEKQKALFGLTGTDLTGSPTDVLAQTQANYAEDQFYDLFNTSQGIYSKELSASALRAEGQASMLSGITSAATTFALRGTLPTKKTSLLGTNDIPRNIGETF